MSELEGKKISQFEALKEINGLEEIPVSKSGKNFKIKLSDFAEKVAEKVMEDNIDAKIDEEINKKLEEDIEGLELIKDEFFESMFGERDSNN